MKKKLIFEVEEGETFCQACPFHIGLRHCYVSYKKIEKTCRKFDLETLEFIGEEDA